MSIQGRREPRTLGGTQRRRLAIHEPAKRKKPAGEAEYSLEGSAADRRPSSSRVTMHHVANLKAVHASRLLGLTGVHWWRLWRRRNTAGRFAISAGLLHVCEVFTKTSCAR